jgi:hypothetical protein
MSARCAFALAALLGFSLAGCSGDTKDSEPSARERPRSLCDAVRHLQQVQGRPADLPRDEVWEIPTDPEAIEAVVNALPAEMKVEASLRYHPHGGRIPEGVDTSGRRASQAVDRLDAFYVRECGFTPTPEPPTSN